MSNAQDNYGVSGAEQYPGEDACFSVEDFADEIADETADATADETPPERLSLEDQLRHIADLPNDRTYLFGTCDKEMLKVMSTISPLLEMRGAANGFAYVNPALSFVRALRRQMQTSAGIGEEELQRAENATRWLADAWESQGSATAMEVMRNLVVREVLADPELEFIVLSRIERCINVVRSAYEDARIDFRGTRA